MNFLGNLLWTLFGGILLWLAWMIAGLLCMITIVGIPIGLQCFKFAALMLAPFGREIDYSQSGTISFLVNILWIVFLGWELAVTAVAVGLVYCVTIIGIPFGLQAFKFARLALMPFGARIVRIS
jgi:uncharacterized membrane protein YccF (DUF307 family)